MIRTALGHYIGQASLTLVLLGALFVGVVLWARWFQANSKRISEWVRHGVDRISNSPTMQGFHARHPRAWNFIVRRFQPGAYLGLHFTVGLIISLAALWLFGGVTEDVINHDPLTQLDLTVRDWFHQHATPSGSMVFAALSWLGSPVMMVALVLSVAAVLAWRRRGVLLVGWVASLAGAGILLIALKHIIQRPRPIYATAFLHGNSYSFPSGHATESLVGYGMLTYFLVAFCAKRRLLQVAIVASCALLIVAIGFSRIYLGVHYFSDVIAGYAAGVLWLSACVTALEIVRRRPGNTRR